MKTLKNNWKIFQNSYKIMNFENGNRKVSSWKRFTPRWIMIYLHYRACKNSADWTLFMRILGKYADFAKRNGLYRKNKPYKFRYRKG
jgi:hypothetical protein